MKKTTYNNAEFMIDEKTLDIYHKGKILKPAYFKKLNRWFVGYQDDTGKNRIVPRSRIICLAFHPNENYKTLQADHIDFNPSNDSPENLRWVTRKQNNSTEHSRIMRNQHRHNKNHEHEVIKATNMITNEVRYFANGKEAAEFIGCSSPLVYRALDSRNEKKRGAKRWQLEWTSELEEEHVKQMKKERMARTDVNDSAKREAAEKIKIEKRMKREQQKMEKREAILRIKLEKEKQRKLVKLEKELDRVLKRIDIWKTHFKKFDKAISCRKRRIEKKIKLLEKEATGLNVQIAEIKK